MRDNLLTIIIIAIMSTMFGASLATLVMNIDESKQSQYEVNFTDEEKELIFETLDEIASQRKVR